MKQQLRQQILSGHVIDATLTEAESLLTEEQKNLYNLQMQTGKKNMFLAYLIWFLFGEYQLHMLYLGILDNAHLKMLRLMGLVLIYFLIGIFIVIPIKIYDAFKIPSYMKDAERIKKARLLFSLIRDDATMDNNQEQENTDINSGLVESNEIVDQEEIMEDIEEVEEDIAVIEINNEEDSQIEEPQINEIVLEFTPEEKDFDFETPIRK